MNKIDKVNQVVEAIKAAFPAHTQTFAKGKNGKVDYDKLVPVTDPQMLPVVLQDFDGVEFAIVWENGSPYEWSYLFPFGGVEKEFGSTIKGVSAMLPKGVWVEALNSFSVAVRFER